MLKPHRLKRAGVVPGSIAPPSGPGPRRPKRGMLGENLSQKFEAPKANWADKLGIVGGMLADLNNGGGTAHTNAARDAWDQHVAQAEAKHAETQMQKIREMAAMGDPRALAMLDPIGARNFQYQQSRDQVTDTRADTAYADGRGDRADDVEYRNRVFDVGRSDRAEDVDYRNEVFDRGVYESDRAHSVATAPDPGRWQSAGDGVIFNTVSGERQGGEPIDGGARGTLMRRSGPQMQQATSPFDAFGMFGDDGIWTPVQYGGTEESGRLRDAELYYNPYRKYSRAPGAEFDVDQAMARRLDGGAEEVDGMPGGSSGRLRDAELYRNPYRIVPEFSKAPGTKFDSAYDQTMAKRLAKWNSGDQARALTQLGMLKDVVDQLESKKNNATGPVVGSIPRGARAFTNPKSIELQEQVESVIQASLRAVLGAQFTEKEGERLMARAYNPRLQEDVNAKKLKNLYNQLVMEARNLDMMSQYTTEHGTMLGYEPQLPGFEQHTPLGDTSLLEASPTVFRGGRGGNNTATGLSGQGQYEKTATNPQTGERMGLRNGKWEPIQ